MSAAFETEDVVKEVSNEPEAPIERQPPVATEFYRLDADDDSDDIVDDDMEAEEPQEAPYTDLPDVDNDADDIVDHTAEAAELKEEPDTDLLGSELGGTMLYDPTPALKSRYAPFVREKGPEHQSQVYGTQGMCKKQEAGIRHQEDAHELLDLLDRPAPANETGVQAEEQKLSEEDNGILRDEEKDGKPEGHEFKPLVGPDHHPQPRCDQADAGMGLGPPPRDGDHCLNGSCGCRRGECLQRRPCRCWSAGSKPG